MRPKKTRWIQCEPGERCFIPKQRARKTFSEILLSLDEFEALRLSDLEGYEQDETARQMKVHRSTVSRILKSARAKIADALVNIKIVKVEGGCCKVRKTK